MRVTIQTLFTTLVPMCPDRSRSEVWTYARDPKVRDEVLRRAKGMCEFCGALGFIKPDGSRYLESHHIIALARDGADRMTNVIALCPNDHREAHFGTTSEQIETEMISRLRIINAENLLTERAKQHKKSVKVELM